MSMNTKSHTLIKRRVTPRSIWLKAEEEALVKVWDNSTDAIHDTL